jgi:malate/lactate dehydrogenase
MSLRAISRNTGDGSFLGSSGRRIWLPRDQYGGTALIGREGVHEILEWKLEPEEQEGLNRSIEILRPSMEYVDKFIEGN